MPFINQEGEIVKKVYKKEEPEEEELYMVLSVDYNGYQTKMIGSHEIRGCAIVKLYDINSGEIKFWVDNTEHLPYMLAKIWKGDGDDYYIVKERVESNVMLNPEKNEQVMYFESVLKRNPLMNEENEEYVKVVASDPLTIKDLRKRMREENIREGKVRYYKCYAYDEKIQMGMFYKIEDDKLIQVKKEIPKEIKEMLEEKIGKNLKTKDERIVFENMCELFFTKLINFKKKLAIDIEIYNVGILPDEMKTLAEDVTYPVLAISFVSLTEESKILKVFILDLKDRKRGDIEKIKERLKKSYKFNYNLDEVEFEFFESEERMLKNAFEIISKYSFIYTFNGDEFDFRYLFNRATKKHGMKNWEIPFILREFMGKHTATMKNGIHIDEYHFLGENASIRTYALRNKLKFKGLDHIGSILVNERKLDVAIADINKYDDYEIGFYCLQDSVTEDSPILIQKDGRIDIIIIKDLFNKYNKNIIKDENERQFITPNEEILVWANGEWTKIRKMMRHKTTKKIYRVKVKEGFVKVTEDHSLFRENGEEVKTNELKEGQHILCSILPKIDIKNNKIHCDYAYVLGFFIAEGHCDIIKRKGSEFSYIYNWSIVNKSKELLEQCKIQLPFQVKIYDSRESGGIYELRLLRDGEEKRECMLCKKKEYYVRGLCRSCYEKEKRKGNIKKYGLGECYKSSKREIIKQWRNWCYNSLGEKKIPEFVYTWDKESIEALLQGLFDGDGSKFSNENAKYEYQQYTTNSHELALGMQLLLKNLTNQEVNYSLRENNVMQLEFNKPNNVQSNFIKNRIKKIQEIPYTNIEEKEDGSIIIYPEKCVYDIETESQKFNIGNITCHNSWITYQLMQYNNEMLMKLITILMRLCETTMDDLGRYMISGWIHNMVDFYHRLLNVVIPNPEEIRKKGMVSQTKAVTKGKKFKGAIVKTPKKGVNFKVVCVDFGSLYATIIKNWNMSYESINCGHKECIECGTNKIPETSYYYCVIKKGLLSIFIGLIRDFRLAFFKPKAKDKTLLQELIELYKTVEQAIKVVGNATYGVFGSEEFYFYCLPVAEAITAIARYSIIRLMKKAGEIGVEVIYSDTDSCFLENPTEEQIKELIQYSENELGVELAVDHEYIWCAFSERKKNYVGLDSDGQLDIKGLVGKKKHIPVFLEEVFSAIMQLLISLRTRNDVTNTVNIIKKTVRELLDKFYKKEFELEDLSYKIELHREIEEYDGNPIHVQVARMMKEKGEQVEVGDTIQYVKTKGKCTAKPLKFVKKNEVDIKKYEAEMRTILEQVLDAFGVSWEELKGQVTKKEMENLIFGGRRN